MTKITLCFHLTDITSFLQRFSKPLLNKGEKKKKKFISRKIF